MRHLTLTAFVAILALTLAACDSSDIIDDEPQPLETILVENIPADPAQNDPETGAPIGNTDRYTLFSLRDNEIVLSYDNPNRADSSSTAWDIGFRGTTLIANGGSSGPGNGGIQVVEGIFEDLEEAPEDGYGPIQAGSDGGWYTYNFTTHIISPTPGRVVVVRTADGRYAKIKIISYYRDAPETPDPMEGARYYTFEYVFQPDGSRNFTDE